MDLAHTQLVESLARHVVDLKQRRGGVLTVGINGAQGSGKSTLAAALSECIARQHDCTTVCLSLDDYYLTKSVREDLSRSVHPLCAVRGVPGTHDVPLALETIRRLKRADGDSQTPFPRFDKLADDRAIKPDIYSGQPAIILFEGWCVGAQPQNDDALVVPVNDLEQTEDPDGVWRRWANGHLSKSYKALWAELDHLIFIQVPDLNFVIDARWQQEKGLALRNPDAPQMTRAEIVHFVAHYERLTRHIWTTMPDQADTLLKRDATGFHDLRLREN